MQIILKKTRAERPERQGAGSSNSSHPDGASSNPYQVKSEPERPHNPYAVKREPDKPRMMSNGRAQQMKKQSPLPDSPSGSTTNSPVRIPPPQNNKGLSESSDSNSSSSSDSDSESDSNASGNEKSKLNTKLSIPH